MKADEGGVRGEPVDGGELRGGEARPVHPRARTPNAGTCLVLSSHPIGGQQGATSTSPGNGMPNALEPCTCSSAVTANGPTATFSRS